ncbi:MAG: lipid-A-disaccharide synthase N-terminal domain-containing protein [Planctomycetes bacterium]|nr:lipid-A-disaccharide synthase N-terminal domain-containing protein [Planctomycetota bacterium]
MKDRSLLGEDSTSPDLPLIPLLFALGIALLLPLINLGQPRLGSPHETRVVVTGQNMAETGDWIVPWFNGAVRLQKPPLPYWTIAAMTKLLGPLEEGLFRLPSALMGVAAILLAYGIAYHLFGSEVALLSALIQSLCVKYVIESRLARVDIYLTFWVTAALFILAIIFFGKQRRDWLWLVFWLAMALGFLSKWVNIFLFVLPPLGYGLYAFGQRRGRWTWHLLGMAAFAVIVAAWLGLVVDQLGWQTVRLAWLEEVQENITSPLHRANHGVFYYIPQLFLLTFPWCALTPVIFIVPFLPRLRPVRPRLLWLFSMVVVPFVMLSVVSKKKVDYLLPALPAMAILMACAWRVIIQELSPATEARYRNRRSPAAYIQPGLLIVVGLAMLCYFLLDRNPERLVAVTVCGVGLVTTGAVTLVQVVRGRGWHAFAAMCLGLALFGHVLFGYFIPRLTQTSPEGFAARARAVIGDASIGFYRGRDDTFVYYLKRPVRPLGSFDQLEAFAAENPGGFVLVVADYLEEARQAAEDVVLHHPRFRDLSVPLPGKQDKATNLYLLSCAPYRKPPEVMTAAPFATQEWIDTESFWVAFGFLAQGMFFGRFLLQWIASESRRESTIPVGFWWLSLTGGVMLLIYVIHRKDIVLILGQATGILIYVRNLYFVYAKKGSAASPTPSEKVQPEPGEQPDVRQPAFSQEEQP